MSPAELSEMLLLEMDRRHPILSALRWFWRCRHRRPEHPPKAPHKVGWEEQYLTPCGKPAEPKR